MRKVLVTIEMEIDEKEIGKIENYHDDYERNMTLEKWIEGLNVIDEGDGNITIGNEIEEYYNVNIGTTKVMRGVEVKSFKIVE